MRKILLVFVLLIIIIPLLDGCRKIARRPVQEKYKDGTYRQNMEPDQEGWAKSIEIKIYQGRITKVSYDEFNPETGSKADDIDYITNWIIQTSTEVNLKKVYTALSSDLIKKQDPQAVDIISGATVSSNIFKYLANKTLKTAKR